MNVHVAVRRESKRTGLYRRDVLERMARRVCEGEGVETDAELSVLFCDDDRMSELNRSYRNKKGPTDVLSFEQPPLNGGPVRLLGDVVISLETAERRCANDATATRAEVRLLFCHGLLHLLGYDHATRADRERMIAKQAEYLGVAPSEAWLREP